MIKLKLTHKKTDFNTTYSSKCPFMGETKWHAAYTGYSKGYVASKPNFFFYTKIRMEDKAILKC